MTADSYTVVYHPYYVGLGVLLVVLGAFAWLITRRYLRFSTPG